MPALPLQLHAQHHDDIGPGDGFLHAIGALHQRREAFKRFRQHRRRPAQHHVGAELGQQMNIGARHAAVSDVADDGHAQPRQRRLVIENRQRIEQRLGGVLVGAVAGVEDRNLEIARQKMRRAGGRVAHHDGVGAHGRQRVQRVEQRFTLVDARYLRRDRDGIRAEALGGNLKGSAGAGGGFVEQVDDGAALQLIELLAGAGFERLVKFGAIQDLLDLIGRELFDPEQPARLHRFHGLVRSSLAARWAAQPAFKWRLVRLVFRAAIPSRSHPVPAISPR